MNQVKNEKNDKNFDAVKTMREIRDQFSMEIMNMSFEEEKQYLKMILSTGRELDVESNKTTDH